MNSKKHIDTEKVKNKYVYTRQGLDAVIEKVNDLNNIAFE